MTEPTPEDLLAAAALDSDDAKVGPEGAAASVSVAERGEEGGGKEESSVGEGGQAEETSGGRGEETSVGGEANAWRAAEQGSGEEVAAAPKVEAQSSPQSRGVEEVGWGAFGDQSRCGSFSDFLAGPSSFPEESNVGFSNFGEESFHFAGTSNFDTGSNFFDQQDDDASVFDLQSSREGQAQQVETTLSATEGSFEPLSGGFSVSGQSNEVEGQAHRAQLDQQQENLVLSQGQGTLVNGNELDSSQGPALQADGVQEGASGFAQLPESPWQEVPEYPGWIYNALTGEWAEKGRHLVQEVTGSSGIQDQIVGDQVNHLGSNAGPAYTSPGVSSIDTTQPAALSVNDLGLAEDYGSSGKADATAYNSYFGQVSTQQVESGLENLSLSTASNNWQSGTASNNWESGTASNNWESGTASNNWESGTASNNWESGTASNNWGTGSSLETQYPGWYYDYQAQEWKQEAQPSPSVAANAQSFTGDPLSSSMAPASYGQATPMAASQMSNGGGWSSSQGQYTADQAFQDGGSQNNFRLNDFTAGHSQNSYATPSASDSPARLWSENHITQYGNSSSYQQTGQPLSNGAILDPGRRDYTTMDSLHLSNHGNAHNQSQPLYQGQIYSQPAPVLPGYEPQPWQPAGMPTEARQSSYLSSQGPPTSSREAISTSAGRPPHVLTTFGFGGKLLVMKLRESSFGSAQAFAPGPIHIHNLSQVVTQGMDRGIDDAGSRYFKALNHSVGSGPLVGGSVSSKDLTKWLAERASNCQSEESNFRSSSAMTMLWGLLNLACKHYGKLRSQAGSAGVRSQGEDSAEGALAKLLTSGSEQSSWTMGSFNSTVCLRPMPSEHEMQVCALEIKKLLVTGKHSEALKRAQQGQLWGLALVLARQIGEQYYADTAAEMARHQFLPGSPLRTLSLLLAGRPAEVFSGNNALSAPLETVQIPSSSASLIEDGVGSMLEEWQENLSIMAANRTNGDDRVISHLGDCLWKVNGEVAAAHICYLVADANFESYSSTARLCLIGADHWKNPRTYATPESIQRTEVYEYSKVSGNPQFILLPFQPYKVVYAAMLAEVGKTSEALRYCQAVLKTLKTTSRVPELESCRLAATSLEERLRFSVQGGSTGNLAPVKFVKEILRVMDRGISGIIGGPPLPAPQGPLQPVVAEPVSSFQDQRTVSSFDSPSNRSAFPFGPSASAEKLKEPGLTMPQRSVSEPDFSATMKEKVEQGKPASRGGYLHRFGSVFSKAGGIVSLVSKPNKNEAKLGDKNTFYYDEKLKRWVEEGGAAAEEEAPLAPPPMSSSFANKVEDPQPDVYLGAGLGAASNPPAVFSGARNVSHSGTPPVPPSNQFSARTRQQGVRSRYVDTFNKGGNSTAQPPKPVASFASAPKAMGTPLQPMNFFVPGPAAGNSTSSFSNAEKESSHSESLEGVGVDGSSFTPEQLQESGRTGQQYFQEFNENAGDAKAFPGAATAAAVGRGSGATDGSGDAFARRSKAPNGEVTFGNGLHTRANSWSGYSSSPFQQFSSQTEIESNHITPGTKFNLTSAGLLTESIPGVQGSVGSYFVPPQKSSVYPATNNSMVTETVVAPPPSWPPVNPMAVAPELNGGHDADFLMTGDSLQEVEL